MKKKHICMKNCVKNNTLYNPTETTTGDLPMNAECFLIGKSGEYFHY